MRSQTQLTMLSASQKEQAYERYLLLRPCLEEGVPQTEVARHHHLSPATVQRQVKRYREIGLAGLIRLPRSDQGDRRLLPQECIEFIEGLALQRPPRFIANIHRRVTALAPQYGWPIPSYGCVYQIVRALRPALLTYAHDGPVTYREEFDLIYRREASHPNEIWQSDHKQLSIVLLNAQGKPMKPYLTAVEDDFSRAIAGYRLSFSPSKAIHTALTLRQAIWYKQDPRWPMCGLPLIFYTDHGSDFTSRHLQYATADLGIRHICSQVAIPRGRGKIERFFLSVEQLLLPDLGGYAPKSQTRDPSSRFTKRLPQPTLTLAQFAERFHSWLLDTYHLRPQEDLNSSPLQRWKQATIVPTMPPSLEKLDELLILEPRARTVQQEGISFQGHRYIDTALQAVVKQEVTIRYDPTDLSQIRVFVTEHGHERFLCDATRQDPGDEIIPVEDIVEARNARRKEIRTTVRKRAKTVKRFSPSDHRAPSTSHTTGEQAMPEPQEQTSNMPSTLSPSPHLLSEPPVNLAAEEERLELPPPSRLLRELPIDLAAEEETH
jgi:putative transposase